MLILSAADMISLLTFVKRAAADEKTVRLIGCCRRSARQSPLAPSVPPQTLASYGPSPLADNARAIFLFNTCTISRLVSSGAGHSTVGVGYLTAALATEKYVVCLLVVVVVVVVVISDTDWVSKCLPLPFFLPLSVSVCSCPPTFVWLPLCVSVFLSVSVSSVRSTCLPLSVSALSAPNLIPSISVRLSSSVYLP